jgi:hypothetical protein
VIVFSNVTGKIMHDNIEQIAIHEAGHALAHILTDLPFSIVTIEPKQLAIHTDGNSLGYIQPINPPTGEDIDSYSKLSPDEFFQCFCEDMTVISGYVAQRVLTKKFDKTGSKTDIKVLYSNSMMNHPEPFRSKYRDFLIAYTFMLFQMNRNKRLIKKIADELLRHKTLGYDQVKKIVEEMYL